LIDEKFPHQSTCLIDDPLMSSTPGLIEGLMRVLALFVRGVILKVGGGIRAVRCASTPSLGVVNFGIEMGRIRPSHRLESVGFGLGIDISITLSQKQGN
jgi:hypothetical protein